ncbi:Uncharacterized protein DBV15_08423 [Temnothorax longispinosus]|uniref:Uncharacterized protein n=1 Tax=Temnothorax longispinosus TaxID=300112 RepID=A0A4S2L174_9HYME|nr:Uncharacterized protein DBV15_08423 [Temnothorax longispinosus]
MTATRKPRGKLRPSKACRYPSNMSTEFFSWAPQAREVRTGEGADPWSRSARRAMSDSRNAAEAIPRNYYATSVGAAPQKRFPRFNSLIPLYSLSRRAVTVDADAHACTVTDSADILVPSIPGISLLSNVRPNRREPSWLALMDDEGKERVIAERLSLSDSRVLSFGRERKKGKGGGGRG